MPSGPSALPLVLPVVFVDIDGTMTDGHDESDGTPRLEVIAKVKRLIRDGYPVYVWSGNALDYAISFCRRHGIQPCAILPKPNIIVDDNTNLLPPSRIARWTPDEFLEADLPPGNQ